MPRRALEVFAFQGMTYSSVEAAARGVTPATRVAPEDGSCSHCQGDNRKRGKPELMPGPAPEKVETAPARTVEHFCTCVVITPYPG